MVKNGLFETEEHFENFLFNSYKIFNIENVKILLSHFLDDSRKEIYYGAKKDSTVIGKDSGAFYLKEEKYNN
jgi:hypothetical protein